MFAVVAMVTASLALHPTSSVGGHDAVDVVLLETCGATAASRALDDRIQAAMTDDEIGRHREALVQIRSVARMTPCDRDLRRRTIDLLDQIDVGR
jgi:hypothetical protein